MDDVDHGAQYRDAKEAIGLHRQRQARAENAYAEAFKRWRQSGVEEMPVYVIDAQAAVEKAVADVEWCKAATVAAGEAYKGEAFDVVLERNTAPRAQTGGGTSLLGGAS